MASASSSTSRKRDRDAKPGDGIVEPAFKKPNPSPAPLVARPKNRASAADEEKESKDAPDGVGLGFGQGAGAQPMVLQAAQPAAPVDNEAFKKKRGEKANSHCRRFNRALKQVKQTLKHEGSFALLPVAVQESAINQLISSLAAKGGPTCDEDFATKKLKKSFENTVNQTSRKKRGKKSKSQIAKEEKKAENTRLRTELAARAAEKARAKVREEQKLAELGGAAKEAPDPFGRGAPVILLSKGEGGRSSERVEDDDDGKSDAEDDDDEKTRRLARALVWLADEKATAPDGIVLGADNVVVMITSPYKKAEEFNIRSIIAKAGGKTKSAGKALFVTDLHKSNTPIRWPVKNLLACKVKKAPAIDI